MAAVAAVLETYELLESVLVMLPSRSIGKAVRVRRSWRQLVERSIRAKQTRCLTPLLDDDQNVDLLMEIFPTRTTYNPKCVVSVNDLLRNAPDVVRWHINANGHTDGHPYDEDEDDDHDIQARTKHILMVPTTIEECQGREDEYATEPPCSVIGIKAFGPQASCMVRCIYGVRVRDLIEVANSIISSHLLYGGIVAEDEDFADGDLVILDECQDQYTRG